MKKFYCLILLFSIILLKKNHRYHKHKKRKLRYKKKHISMHKKYIKKHHNRILKINKNEIEKQCNYVKLLTLRDANLIVSRQNQIIIDNLIEYFRKENIIYTFTANKLHDTMIEKIRKLLNNFSNISYDNVAFVHNIDLNDINN